MTYTTWKVYYFNSKMPVKAKIQRQAYKVHCLAQRRRQWWGKILFSAEKCYEICLYVLQRPLPYTKLRNNAVFHFLLMKNRKEFAKKPFKLIILTKVIDCKELFVTLKKSETEKTSHRKLTEVCPKINVSPMSLSQRVSHQKEWTPSRISLLFSILYRRYRNETTWF